MSLTVTAAQAGTGIEAGMALTVKVLTGQAASPIGTTGNSGTITTPQLAITPGFTGSWVYGADCVAVGGVTFTPAATTTFSYNATNNNGSTTWSFGTYRSTAATTASTPVTLGATAPTSSAGATGLAQCEIKAGTGLAEDASAPATAVTTAATSVVTGSFTPPPGSLLVAMAVSHATGNTGEASTLAVSDTSGLTWTPQAVATVTAGTGTFQIAGVWTAPVPGGTDATVTMGSALAVATAQPAPQAGSLTSPAYAATATDLGGGAGSWASPANAQGTGDGSFATWTAP